MASLFLRVCFTCFGNKNTKMFECTLFHFFAKRNVFEENKASLLVFPQMWPAGSCQKFSQKQFIIEIVFPGNLQKGKEKRK